MSIQSLGGLIQGSIPELQAEIFQYLELEDLLRVYEVSKGAKAGVSKRIEIAFIKIDSIKRKINGFTEESREITLPAEITAFLNTRAPKAEQVKLAEKWMDARDILVVWKAINKQADINPELKFSFDKAQDAIDKASQFPEWMQTNWSKLQNIKVINLHGLQLRSIPEELFQLQNLELLNLSENSLKKLPKAVCSLKKLVILHVSRNQLTALPKGLSGLQDLMDLCLLGNQFRSLPEEVCNLQKLFSLDISNNEFTALPEVVYNLKNLHSLNISNNKIQELPENLCALQELSQLYLSDNLLSEIPDWLSHFNKLECLSISEKQRNLLSEQLLRKLNESLLIDVGQRETNPRQLLDEMKPSSCLLF